LADQVKVRNETAWRTDHLRHFVREIAKRELEPGNRKRTTVTFRHCGGSSIRKVQVHGHVFIHHGRRKDENGGDVTIFLPRPWDEAAWFNQAVAMVLAHEFAHIATGESGRAWELRRRSSPRYGYGYGKNAGRFKEWYQFALAWSLDPA
jgi:hypothetical protein